MTLGTVLTQVQQHKNYRQLLLMQPVRVCMQASARVRQCVCAWKEKTPIKTPGSQRCGKLNTLPPPPPVAVVVVVEET
eukprot:6765-Heterococcus_DN1.PRE.1